MISLLTRVPALFSGPYALLARAAVVALVVGSIALWGWQKGNAHGTQKLLDFQAALLTETSRVATARAKAAAKVITRYVQVKGETQVVTQTVEKETIKYVVQNPTGVCLDPEWRRVHDAAARGAAVSGARLRLDGELRTLAAVTGGG